MNKVRVEKNSVEKIARHRYKSESATTTTARLAGAMLCYMCDATGRKLLQFDPNGHAPLTRESAGREQEARKTEGAIKPHFPTPSAAVKPVPRASSQKSRFSVMRFNIKV